MAFYRYNVPIECQYSQTIFSLGCVRTSENSLVPHVYKVMPSYQLESDLMSCLQFPLFSLSSSAGCEANIFPCVYGCVGVCACVFVCMCVHVCVYFRVASFTFTQLLDQGQIFKGDNMKLLCLNPVFLLSPSLSLALPLSFTHLSFSPLLEIRYCSYTASSNVLHLLPTSLFYCLVIALPPLPHPLF